MTLLNRLSFGLRQKLPTILQTEATECGLACLAMVASHHGHATDLNDLRQRFAVSQKGTTLESLIQMGQALRLGTRPVKLDLDALNQLSLPCILHWNFNHFVVLARVGNGQVTIHDPAIGQRVLRLEELSRSFTGVALELWPEQDFTPKAAAPSLPLRSLFGRVSGWRRSAAQIVLLALALEALAIVGPFYLQWTIDNAILAADRGLLTTLAIGFTVVMLLRLATGALRSWAILYLSTTLNLQWRANLFTHLVRLPVQYFERRHMGDVMSRFGAIDQIQRTLTTSFLEAVLDGIMALVTFIVMYLYSPELTGWAMACLALYAITRLIWYGPLRDANLTQIVHAAKQQSHFLETVRGVKAIKLFQRQDQRRASWLTLLVEQINAGLRVQKLQLLFQLLNGVLFGGATILIIWRGANLVLDGTFTVGLLTAFLAYKSQFDVRVGSLIDKFLELRMLRLHGERLADIALTPVETTAGTAPLPTNALTPPVVELRDVRFRYADGEPLVLDGVNLRLEPGESVAIVGASGCGKTTLLNVMLGVLQPNDGELLLNGRPLRQCGLDSLRQLVGTVLQDDILFAGSIRDNISFFDPQADPAWVARCAQMAAIDAEIAAMPMAYNTLVGDMGTVLSGGQKQRVLLARALYKRPAILFLDEATSHLDIGKELQVNQAIKALSVTRVIIAHRPETIASAGRVVLLTRGKLVAPADANELAIVTANATGAGLTP
ncbi:MAG TPA: peptidase domain-containing ABC transporter [Duganella sp.]|nr:peptidase domain-containing ABC transporter [Duganella sp.]